MVARTRRQVLAAALAAAAVSALIAVPAAGAKAKGFSHGVTAAEVTSSSAILWAHADKSGKTFLQLAHNTRFGPCDKENSYAKVKAKGSNDNTVQKKVKGLPDDTNFKYRYCTADGDKSDTGKFTTAPKSKANETISFALSGDQDARPDPGGTTPHFGNFDVWTAIRQQKNAG